MPQAVSPFVLDSFDSEPAYFEKDGVQFARSHIDKTFYGDIEATSSVEMLSVRTDAGGAGYVGLERITGKVHGQEGSFGLLHIGTMTEDDQWSRWPISPGSGTGALAGIRGEARIDIAPDGAHTLFLDYELG